MKVKICCIQSIAEMELAIRCGASAIGLVSAMPSGPGPIPEERIAEIARVVPAGIDSFLLTSEIHAAKIIAQHHRCGTTTIQLTDQLDERELRELRRELQGIKLVQVIHVTGPESVTEANWAAQFVDMLLLDSGRPNAAIKELGGTGRTHNWSVSREIVAKSPVPVWLAGGLKAENAAEAIRAVRPHGLDICSGVRVGDRLDELRLRAFFYATNKAISNDY
jgi:phosphoribosylanthranilate isomerase